MEVEAGEKAWLQAEIEVFLTRLEDAEAKGRYAQLLESVKTGQVPERLLGDLERLLEIGLETGRIRKIYGPHGEQVFIKLYGRTPRGSGILKLVEEVNEAFKALVGHVIDEIAFSPKGPGSYRLVIDTDRCRVTVGIDRDGIKAEGVEIGI